MIAINTQTVIPSVFMIPNTSFCVLFFISLLRFKAYENTAPFGIIGAEAPIYSNPDIGIGIAAENFSRKHFCRVQIVGVANTDFPPV